MSVKSLLQLILFFLILIIVGGIYFLYFYQGQNKITLSNNIELEKLDTNFKSEEELFNENLLEDNSRKKERSKESKNINEDNSLNNKKIKNLTTDIEYVTTNKKGDIFKILAKYGKTNLENNDLLDLESVNGTIKSSERSTIYISSDYAKYNYDNQNSKFYNNVIIKYDNKVITCDNLDLEIKTNYAIAYNNVEIKDDNSVMKAQVVRLNILTKDIEINSQDKIKIITN